MSVRFLKIFLIVTALHLLILTVVWVGFPTPLAKSAGSFMYEGDSLITDTISLSSGNSSLTQDKYLSLEHQKFDAVNYWTKLRNPSKIPKYDRLGL